MSSSLDDCFRTSRSTTMPRCMLKELLKKPEVSNDEFYSLFAKESFGIKTPFLKAGVSHNASSGAYYFEWDEDVLVFPGLRVAAKTFDMHPPPAQA